MFVIANLKKQITSLKIIIKTKDEEIEEIKKNTKYAKFSLLEQEYHQKIENYGYLLQHNEFLQNNLEE